MCKLFEWLKKFENTCCSMVYVKIMRMSIVIEKKECLKSEQINISWNKWSWVDSFYVTSCLIMNNLMAAVWQPRGICSSRIVYRSFQIKKKHIKKRGRRKKPDQESYIFHHWIQLKGIPHGWYIQFSWQCNVNCQGSNLSLGKQIQNEV